MGVNANTAVDFAAIGSTMAEVTSSWMNASINIVDPNVGEVIWDEWTNTETGGEPTVLWSGKARIQPLSNVAVSEAGFSEIGVRHVRIQVPLDVEAGFIRKGFQIVVTDPGNDYVLSNMQFVITGAVNSSYAWLRTIACEVDVKNPYTGG